jgi:hypothetical protein
MLKSLGMTAWPLPPAPGALPRLGDLQASHNPIKSIPADALLACPNLRNLELASVPGAAFLPAGCLAAVPQLETLDLGQTGCSEIGGELLAMLCLRVLNLNGNRISSLPVELTRLSRWAGQRRLPAGQCQKLLTCTSQHVKCCTYPCTPVVRVAQSVQALQCGPPLMAWRHA